MNDFGRNFPAENHWGNLTQVKGKEKINYSLYVEAPEMKDTGLHPSITKLCATVAAVLEDGASDCFLGDSYKKQTPEQRQKSTKDSESMLYDKIRDQVGNDGSLELLPDHIFDDHGDLKFALAPMGTAIIKQKTAEATTMTTMIIGWRGSTTAVDWLQDFGVAPIISKTWDKYAPGLRVHAGMAALMENEMTTHGKTIKEQIEKNNVTQVVFTGHSLGGGLAYVAHLYALATWGVDTDFVSSTNKEPMIVTFRALAFEAPMAFYLPAESERDPKLKTVLETLEESSRNFVFCGDFVPHLPGNAKYVQEVFDKIKAQHRGAVGAVVNKLFSAELDAKIVDLQNNLGKYNHCSKIIYYEEAEQKEPALLSGIEFKEKTLKDVIEANDVQFDRCETNPKLGFDQAGKFLKRMFGKDGPDFKSIPAFLNDAHGVLPYAMSPSYKNLKYDDKGKTMPGYGK